MPVRPGCCASRGASALPIGVPAVSGKAAELMRPSNGGRPAQPVNISIHSTSRPDSSQASSDRNGHAVACWVKSWVVMAMV